MNNINELTARLKAAAENAKDDFIPSFMVSTRDVLELIAALEAARADCRENAARIAELESQRALAFSACNRWADKCREAEKRVAELERQAIQPLPIGELINRLEEQTGEPWGEVYLAGINFERGK